MPERDWTSQSMVVLFCHVCLTMPAQSFRVLTLIRVSASPSQLPQGKTLRLNHLRCRYLYVTVTA